ncbi:MAG TPA: LysR family substrate-binding domain-containing protein, partial [Verrucomicrobiae bacterium]|nr:LysR family substrate-binding domain-containing protein [Verrucomicrobiae bacterium]
DLSATAQAEALAAGKLDFGLIGFAHEADGARLEKMKIGACDFVAALPAGHAATRKAKLSLARLANDLFFTISEQTYPGAAAFMRDACARAGFRPRVLQTAERGHTILGLVAGHCGVALLPEPLRALPHPGVVFRPLAEPVHADLYLAWKPGADSEVLRGFREASVAS